MKRLLFSLVLGTVFVVLYLSVGAVIIMSLTNGFQDTSHIPTVDYAMRLPKIVYYYFYPPTSVDYSVELSAKKGLLGTAFLLANVGIYSLAAYILLSIFSRFHKVKPEVKANPPPPPSFDA